MTVIVHTVRSSCSYPYGSRGNLELEPNSEPVGLDMREGTRYAGDFVGQTQ